MEQLERITPTGLRILEALATYRFLTSVQMLALGATAAKGHLYVTLRELATKRPAVIGSQDFGALPGRGRLPLIYFLTADGASLVEEVHRHAIEVSYPRTVSVFNQDYFHRVNCIDFQIAVRRFAEREHQAVDFFHTYYDQGTQTDRGGWYPKTRIALASGILVPDAVFSLTDDEAKRRLFAFEMCNRSNTLRVEQQLTTYAGAIEGRAIELAYEYAHRIRILFVFDDEASLMRVRNRIARSAAQETLAPAIFFKTLTEVTEDFLDGWRKIGGEGSVALF